MGATDITIFPRQNDVEFLLSLHTVTASSNGGSGRQTTYGISSFLRNRCSQFSTNLGFYFFKTRNKNTAKICFRNFLFLEKLF